MKKLFMAATMAATVAIAGAQSTSVTLTKVLDTAIPGGAGDIYAATYVPGGSGPNPGKFIASKGGTVIDVLNASTGAPEGVLSLSGIAIATGSLGFFALTATADGVIYGWEDGGDDIWRWGSVSDTAPQKVYDSAPGTLRVGATGKSGSDIAIAFTGAAIGGPVQFYSDTFPFSTSSFVFNEAPALEAKSAVAINGTGNKAWTISDSAGKLKHWVETDGVWNPVWTYPGGTDNVPAGPIAYDETHDVLFVLAMTSPTIGPVANPSPNPWYKNLTMFKGSTGAVLGTILVETPPNATAGYHGAYVAPSTNGGTLYMASRGEPKQSTALYVYDYVVTTSAVNDWSLYQQ